MSKMTSADDSSTFWLIISYEWKNRAIFYVVDWGTIDY